MQKKAKNRLKILLFCLLCSSIGIYIILYNLKDNITFFYTPSKINEVKLGQEFRIGGLVKIGSIQKISADKVEFTITDNLQEQRIVYQGVLPSLFRESQGIVAVGKISDSIFIAKELLTKHDENYFPVKID